MKKSIMLSATIMLIILFLTLSTTTFAWYQAQGGNITVSGSSTANVTTTGPDSPYLVIANSTGTIATVGKTISAVTSDDYIGENIPLLSSITVTPANNIQLAYPTNTSTPAFSSPVSGSINNNNMYKMIIYVKNTSGSFSLSSTLAVTQADVNNTAIPNSYAYLVTAEATDETTQVIHSSYYDNTHVSQSASSNSVTFVGGKVYTITVYFWINNSADYSTSYSVNQITDITPRVTFDNVSIVTSGS